MPGATADRSDAARSARHSAVDATREMSGSSHRTSKTQSRSAGDLNSCSKKHSSPYDGRMTLRPLMPLRSFSRTAARLARRRAASMSARSFARTSDSANSSLGAAAAASASRPCAAASLASGFPSRISLRRCCRLSFLASCSLSTPRSSRASARAAARRAAIPVLVAAARSVDACRGGVFSICAPPRTVAASTPPLSGTARTLTTLPAAPWPP
mmetsp:Transcript_3874/g.17082  ORF Transcript_3874/g.17082 Transcript_3874/m.17082 type:complete len:213 (+) Transcript_3874:4905-5543(+)